MKIKIKKNFMKEVPIEKQELVKKKLHTFATLLPEKKTLSAIPKGFWVRNVIGTDIYKFQVNSGDRILFKYDTFDGEEAIIFLSYQKHDDQIRVAKSRSNNGEEEDLFIHQEEYVDEPIDEQVDRYVREEIYGHLELIRQEAVFEDEYINLVIEDDEINANILSLEQFRCLTDVLEPVIVFGCAGSGKTSIAIRKLLMNRDVHGSSLYVTKSPMIIEKTKSMVQEQENIQFLTLKELLLKELAIEEAVVIGFEDFEQWLEHEQMEQNNFSTRDVWLEINSILKGNVALGSKMLSKGDYFSSKESAFDETDRKKMYQLASRYELWLKVNGYYDYNDLAYMVLKKKQVTTYENIVFDEAQELTKRQLLCLLRMIALKENIMLLGDMQQVTDQYRFPIAFLKNELYAEGFTLKEYFIYKNYRSGDETIHLINGLKEITFPLFSDEGLAFRQYEVPVRKGIKPMLFHEKVDVSQMFHLLENDVDTIVIVSDRAQKQELLDMGLKRIFTIEETRGLEYKKVFGYNLLSGMKEIWSQVLQGKEKVDDLYRAYFNLIYLALTRSKEKLYLLESKKTILEEKLFPYFDREKKLEAILATDVHSSEKEHWLKEAEKLFKLRNYEKAADAYEKAGFIEKRDQCLKLARHQVLYDYSEKYRSFIQLSSQACTAQTVRIMLDFIKKKYGTDIAGVVYLLIPVLPKYGGNYKRLRGFLEPDWSNQEKANYLYELVSQSIFVRTELTLIATLFMHDDPVTLTTITKSEHPDIHVEIFNRRLRIHSTTLREKRDLENLYDALEEIHNQQFEIEGEYGFPFVEERKSKYKDATADDILKTIFKK